MALFNGEHKIKSILSIFKESLVISACCNPFSFNYMSTFPCTFFSKFHSVCPCLVNNISISFLLLYFVFIFLYLFYYNKSPHISFLQITDAFVHKLFQHICLRFFLYVVLPVLNAYHLFLPKHHFQY